MKKIYIITVERVEGVAKLFNSVTKGSLKIKKELSSLITKQKTKKTATTQTKRAKENFLGFPFWVIKSFYRSLDRTKEK